MAKNSPEVRAAHKAEMEKRRQKRGQAPKKAEAIESPSITLKASPMVMLLAASGAACFCAAVGWYGFSGGPKASASKSVSLPKLELPKDKFEPDPAEDSNPFCLVADIPFEKRKGAIKLMGNFNLEDVSTNPDIMPDVVKELNKALAIARSYDRGAIYNKLGAEVGAFKQGFLALSMDDNSLVPSEGQIRPFAFHQIIFNGNPFTIEHDDNFRHASGTLVKIGNHELDMMDVMYQISSNGSSIVTLKEDAILVGYTVDAKRCKQDPRQRSPQQGLPGGPQ